MWEDWGWLMYCNTGYSLGWECIIQNVYTTNECQQSIFGGKGYLVFFLSLQIADIFSPIPDCTNLKQHDIDTSPRVVLCKPPL